jgi:hypothetical protein
MTKKMIIGACLFTFLSIFVLGATNGMAAPAPKAVKEVVDYFYNGQADGPILTDAKLCKSIAALECEAALHVWMQFFVPKGAVYDDIIVEYKHEGVPRHLKARGVEGSIRYRVVDKFKVDKPGKWTVTIKKGVANLWEFNFTAVE